MSRRSILFLLIAATGVITAGITAYYLYRPNAVRVNKFRQWMRDPASHPDWKLTAGSQCGTAPFLFPTDGLAGFLWGDSFGLRHTHQGIDVFAGTDVGITRVVSAYPGYLTRLPEWKSAVIVRVPEDPLRPGRQIWLYYTHMADRFGNSYIANDFPAGTSEKLVEAGTFLGYQGNFSGDPNNPVGVHLHFSIVEDDGNGKFKNELEINNTLDPSPYLGLPLNGYENRNRVPSCEVAVE
jgi:hypothetical protein